jgi:hypothetical protein
LISEEWGSDERVSVTLAVYLMKSTWDNVTPGYFKTVPEKLAYFQSFL